jgi:allantoicase
MSDFTDLVDLASAKLGGTVLYANDDFFASKDNLLKPEAAIFIEGKYTDRGKWMDGWESRRRRTLGHDFCLIRLGAPGVVRGVVVDTAFFKGNYPQACSIDACAVDGQPPPEALMSDGVEWVEVLPKVNLLGDTPNKFAIHSPLRFTHLRLNIYPDGGVARLRVHGDVIPNRRFLGPVGAVQEIDLAAIENGGAVVACNDMFFGSRHNLIMPGRSVNMGDGWETKRSRKEAPDWCVVQLAVRGHIARVEVDTNHFKGNYPESFALDVCNAEGVGIEALAHDDTAWTELVHRTKLQPHTRHFYEHEIHTHAEATHVRMRIFPDGGISRLRLWGFPSANGKVHAGLRYLATLPAAALARELFACCGSRAWANALIATRPFSSLGALLEESDAAWAKTTKKDWLEAFQSHPRIGESRAKREQSASAQGFSSAEQSKVTEADVLARAELASVNEVYEKKFGFIYIVCATGKTVDEMLAIAKLRMNHDVEAELRVAAEEQRKITSLRLEKLVRR